MAYATDRVILFDRNMLPLDEIGPDEIFSRVRTEEINGEHSLVLVTTRRLQEGWRALTVDGTGRWREWVVTEIDEEHTSGKHALGTYHLVWSLQYDLTMTYTHTHTEIGYGHMPKSAGEVAMIVCRRTSWGAGHECDAPDVPDGSGAVFIYESAWSKLSKAVECMNCEVDTDIRVEAIADPDFDLTTPFLVTRLLNLRAHIGSQTALRRFDWNEDLTSIKRIPDPGPYYCRVVPLGKRKDAKPEYADDDKTTFDWPLDITEETGTEENPGPYYIEDPEAALAFRRMNSIGDWVYPTKAVNYDENDPELLLKVAQEDLHNHTRPGVTYEADVLQFAQAGMDVQGVALGDEVQIVDYGFNPDAGLRIQGRVIKIEVDELSPETTTTLTIGQLRDELTDTINNALSSLSTSISSTSSTITHMSTSDYIDELIDRINAEINAGGGYTYLVPGEGLIVYDKAVSDPLIGSEAESVVQIKDGAIRIANSRKPQFSGIDDWNWKSVFRSGLIATEVLNATNIITGLIQDAAHRLSNGDPTVGNYWDLDGSTLVLNDGTIIADLIKGGTLLLGGSNNQNGLLNIKDADGNIVVVGSEDGLEMRHIATTASNTYVFGSAMLNDGSVYPLDNASALTEEKGVGLTIVSNSGTTRSTNGGLIRIQPTTSKSTVIYSNRGIELQSQSIAYYKNTQDTDITKSVIALSIGATSGLSLYHLDKYTDYNSSSPANRGLLFSVGYTGGATVRGGMSVNGPLRVTDTNGTSTLNSGLKVYKDADIDGDLEVGTPTSTAHFRGSVVVNGTKPRAVDTKDYGTKLLYCLETPSPMFSDIGSATLGEDGVCIVAIDDIFAQTARVDCSYQVMLQKCGQGDLWVASKSADCFIVEGTPNLKFDWMLCSMQTGFETLRLETLDDDKDISRAVNEMQRDVVDVDYGYDVSLNDPEQPNITIFDVALDNSYDEFVSECAIGELALEEQFMLEV